MGGESDTVRTRAKEFLESIKGITDVEPQYDELLPGGGSLVTTKLKKDTWDSWGWYFEKGEIKKALFTGEEIAKFIAGVVAPKSVKDMIQTIAPIDLVKLSVVSFLTVLFSISVVYVAINLPENPALQTLTGLLGLTIGYFVGKGDKSS